MHFKNVEFQTDPRRKRPTNPDSKTLQDINSNFVTKSRFHVVFLQRKVAPKVDDLKISGIVAQKAMVEVWQVLLPEIKNPLFKIGKLTMHRSLDFYTGQLCNNKLKHIHFLIHAVQVVQYNIQMATNVVSATFHLQLNLNPQLQHSQYLVQDKPSQNAAPTNDARS